MSVIKSQRSNSAVEFLHTARELELYGTAVQPAFLLLPWLSLLVRVFHGRENVHENHSC